MKKLLKNSLISIVILFFLVTFTVILIPVFINVRQYIPEIEEQLSLTTHRSISIGSDLSVSFFPWISISFSDLHIGNPVGFQSEDFLKIESLEARIDLVPLLKNEIRVSRFVVGGLEINLEKRKDGLGNWVFENGKDRLGSPAPLFSETEQFLLEKVVVGLFAVTDGTVYWYDQANKSRHEVTDLMLMLNDVKYNEPFMLDSRSIIDGIPLSFEGTLGTLYGAQNRGELSVDLKVAMFEDYVGSAKGKLKKKKSDLKYNLSFDFPSLSSRSILRRHNTLPFVSLNPDAIGDMDLQMRLSGDRDGMVIENGVATIDDSRFDFSCSMSDFSQPALTFTLDLDRIDMRRYLSSTGDELDRDSEEQAVETETGSSLAHKIVIDGTISIGEIFLDEGKLADLKMDLVGKEGLFTVDPITFSLYQGMVESKLAYNIQNAKPEIVLFLTSTAVQAGPLLRSYFNDGFLEGRVETDLYITATGDTLAEFQRSLTGDVSFVLSDGAILGYNLVEASDVLRPYASEVDGKEIEPRTKFSKLHSLISIKDGLMTSRQTELESALFNMHISGTADIVSKNVELEIVPVVADSFKKQDDEEHLAETTLALKMTGSFDGLSLHPDSLGNVRNKGLELPTKADVKALVDEKLPSPVDEDVKDLIGKSLIDPAIVAQRFGLQPELLPRVKEKKILRLGTGKVTVVPLRKETGFN